MKQDSRHCHVVAVGWEELGVVVVRSFISIFILYFLCSYKGPKFGAQSIPKTSLIPFYTTMHNGEKQENEKEKDKVNKKIGREKVALPKEDRNGVFP